LPAAYCDKEDLLLGDLEVGPSVALETYVNAAAEEMNSRLGFVYKVPIEPKPPETALATHEGLLLKDINRKLATGRLILAMAQAGEDNNEHAYGASLVKDALYSLNLLTSRQIDLVTAVLAEGNTAGGDTSPLVHNHDEESLVDGFEHTVLRSE
jgi:hypothetical protein